MLKIIIDVTRKTKCNYDRNYLYMKKATTLKYSFITAALTEISR